MPPLPEERKPDASPSQHPATLDTVLIAEDDPVFRHLLRSWLVKWRYQVISANDGNDAWNILQQDDAPKMAILDWMMPGIDGIELCRRVRDREHGLYHYLLLLTAKDEKQDVVAGLEAGADDYLTKPFNLDELRARVRAGRRILELQDALIKAQDALRFEAAHDPLTGLWNRAAILSALQRELQRSARTRVPLGILMADIDYFKKVNDSYGHLVGDTVLREVAHRLANGVRGYDAVGRYGGEEFLIVLPGCSSADLAASAERLRSCIADQAIVTATGPLSLTLSMGIASAELSHNVESPDYELLVHAADEALYTAKRNGRNRVEVALACDRHC